MFTYFYIRIYVLRDYIALISHQYAVTRRTVHRYIKCLIGCVLFANLKSHLTDKRCFFLFIQRAALQRCVCMVGELEGENNNYSN